MSDYLRSYRQGPTYFFTVVSNNRRPILCLPQVRSALRLALLEAKTRWPFDIDAYVLMPDHMHCIWTLSQNDLDFAKRWSLIKRKVSQQCKALLTEDSLSSSRAKRRELTLWQRRFWEHCIRDDDDFAKHMDYIHYNPVKHQLCDKPQDWPFSTIHRLTQQGSYSPNWCEPVNLSLE